MHLWPSCSALGELNAEVISLKWFFAKTELQLPLLSAAEYLDKPEDLFVFVWETFASKQNKGRIL